MGKVVKHVVAVSLLFAIAFVLWRLWGGYRTGWMVVPNQVQYRVDIGSLSPAEVRARVADFASKEGMTPVETGIVGEFQALKDGRRITWRYPMPNSKDSALYGGIEIWGGDDVEAFREAVRRTDEQVPLFSRVVKVLLILDSRTHDCSNDCRIELQHPINFSQFDRLVKNKINGVPH